MALIDLKSDLSWYGKTPPGGVTNNDKNITRFKYNDDLTVSVTPQGQLPRVSADGLPLDNGSASRKAQLGDGTRFPIGPEGQVHEFDIKRTGWYIGRPYSAIYNNKVPFGLAASYTNNSPIDDMYNKFKVRDEAYDPFGYAKPPFILRGIQQDGESDPQRWGLAGTALANASMEVPRGGIVASVERAALDAVRLGKFLIRPQGLLFIAKQQLLHLMNPNTENVAGLSITPGRQKLFNPVNMLASAVGGIAGIRLKRYGVPFEGDGATYEEIIKLRGQGDAGSLQNRLAVLNAQRELPADVIPSWLAISAPLGPDSVGGLGATTFTKRDIYDTYRGRIDVGGSFVDANFGAYTFSAPYAGKPGPLGSSIRVSKTKDALNEGIPYPGTAFALIQEFMPFVGDPVRQKKFTLYGRYSTIMTDSDKFPLTSFSAQLAFNNQTIANISSYDVWVGINRVSLSDTNPGQRYARNYTRTEDAENNLTSFHTSPYGQASPQAANSTTVKQLKDSIDITQINKAQDKFWGGTTQIEEQKIVENRTAPDAIQNYRALTYGDVHRLTVTEGRRGAQNGTLLDFRTGEQWSTSDEYRKNTLENYYGYKPYNAANRKNSKPDPVNNTPYGTELTTVKDLIKFRFESVGFSGTNGRPIIFRAYINNLSDTFSPSWNPSQDQGRADPKVLYSSFGREISVDFKVVVHSADEQHNVWDKLSALARNTYPVYAGNGFHGQFIRVTIGDLYVGQYMYITSLTYDWDNETPWEITDGVQLPMYTNVNMSLSWVGTSKPKAEQIPYSYGGNSIPSVYADVPNSSGNTTYQSQADTSPTPAPGDASTDPKSFDANGNQTDAAGNPVGTGTVLAPTD
jgi:hypothetical protein